MGGIYAREDGHPEAVWKAIALHYLPFGVEPNAPPTREQLGPATVTWAAVSLADKLDTVVGLFAAGERPTGSRDPYGLRRAAQGIARTLVDLPEITGIDRRLTLGPLVEKAQEPFRDLVEAGEGEQNGLWTFLRERVQFVLESRGYDVRNVRSVTHEPAPRLSPLTARRKLEVLPEFTDSPEFRQLATLFKRVRNIAKNLDAAEADRAERESRPLAEVLTEPAEAALVAELETRRPIVERAVETGQGFRQAFAEASRFGPTVATFFDDVLVMADDPPLREGRLRLLKRLEALILSLADVSEIVPEEK
jgi:glycyl-tRNA synthetase beta chain